ncbi:MAG: NusG domain II-containing protein [Eubacterium sp.]
MKKADIILIAAVIAVAGVLIFFLYGVNSDSGAYVRIEIDGEVSETLPLDTDATREIITDNGGTNTLVIKDGYAKMTDANCPDGICVNHQKIKRNGESIICLPHKVVVTVVNENDTDEIDAVA